MLRIHTLYLLFAFCISLALPHHLQAASDCSGPWQVLQNRGGQSPCRALGLDSKRGTCRPGDTYEVLCDDIKGGKYRTCQGPRRCSSSSSSGNNDCTNWDYNYSKPCPKGYRNNDCRGGCETASGSSNDCTGWDYNYEQPCPKGFINRDCRGGCEPR